MAVRLSHQLENSTPGAVPTLGVPLTGRRDVLFFAFANCEQEKRI
jgi:hypothetical protein